MNIAIKLGIGNIYFKIRFLPQNYSKKIEDYFFAITKKIKIDNNSYENLKIYFE